MLFFICEFVLALFAYRYYHHLYNHYCDNLMLCWLSTIDYTFKMNGGSGGWTTYIE